MDYGKLLDQIESKQAGLVVIGLGYVGLPVACLFADAGLNVTGLDVDEAKVDTINQGICPIEGKEPGLPELVSRVVGGSSPEAADAAVRFYRHIVEADLDPVDCLTAELVNKAPNRHMLYPGAGVGGHCIPKDPWLLIANASEGFEPRLIPTARAVNDGMPHHMVDLTVEALEEARVATDEAKVAVLGYAYLEN